MGSPQKVIPVFLLGVFLGSCQPVPVQQPPGSSPVAQTYPGTPTPGQPMNLPPPANLPPPGAQPQPQVSGSRRTEYVWQKMMEGVAMGGAVGGPFGAGGGLIVGLIAGLLTADSFYADLNAKIQTEQAKDRELEAQIEREIERQQELQARHEKPNLTRVFRMKPIEVGEHIVFESPTGQEQIYPRLKPRHSLLEKLEGFDGK